MKSEKCKNCLHYTAYYKQMCDGYLRLSNGFCSKHNLLQERMHTCEKFASNENKEKRKASYMLNILETSLKSINTIAQILKEKEKAD